VSTRSRHHTLLLVACFAAVYLLWGSTFLGNKIALRQIPPMLLSGFRFELAGLLLLAVVALTGRLEPGALTTWRHWRTAILTGGLLFLLANGLLSAGLARPVPTGIAALIVGSTPISLVTMDRLQTGRGWPGRRIVIGMALGLMGVTVLVWGSMSGGDGSRPLELTGALMVFASTLFWGAGTILGRSMPQPRNPLTASALQMMAGGCMLLLTSSLFEAWAPVARIPASDPAWLAVLFLVFGGSLTGFTAYMWLVRNTSAAAVATYAYVNPLVAMVLGWLFLEERPHARTAVAAALILGGVVLMQTGRRKAGKSGDERQATPQPGSEETA
jgi:drug/metabolite transporter (DMT)-like permease